MSIKFKDQEHKDFYLEMLFKDRCGGDRYREALFYTLGISADARKHINDLYDFGERGIDPEGLDKGWQTSGSRGITRLAFNLYNGFSEDGRERLSTPYELFGGADSVYMLEAVRVRFGF